MMCLMGNVKLHFTYKLMQFNIILLPKNNSYVILLIEVIEEKVKWGVYLKLIIDQSLENDGVEIIIKCGVIDSKLEKLIDQIRLYSFSITCTKDGATHIIKLEDIYYFESMNEITFLYCNKDVFECNMKLYEIEEMVEKTSFVRVSKSCILNINKITSVKASINGRFEVTLKNNEQIIVNRHYVKSFKEKFNI